jgi:hypothetical protein
MREITTEVARQRVLSVRLSESEYNFLREVSAREDLHLGQTMRRGLRLLKERSGGGGNAEPSESEPQEAA